MLGVGSLTGRREADELRVMILSAIMTMSLSLALAGVPQAIAPGEALREAARQGDLERVVELLAQGVPVDAPTRYGATPLFYAADRGHFDVVGLLVERGADVDVQDTFYGSTVLSRALGGNHLEIARYLLEQGAGGADGAIVVAARRGHRELLEAAVAAGGIHAEALESARQTAQRRGDQETLALLADVVPVAAPPPVLDEESLRRYVGLYENDSLGQTVEVTLVDARLVARIADEPAARLTPATESSFTADSGDLTVSFNGRGGMVERLILARGGASNEYRPIGESESREAAPVGADDVITGASLPPAPRTAARPWPSFRGPNGSGIADGQGAPVAWDAASGDGVAWKTPIPGFANSAPIIWGDQVFVTTAISSAGNDTFRIGQYGDTTPVDDLSDHTWRIYSLDRRSGDVLWERTVYEGPPLTKRHTKASQANSTPVTDGEHVVAVFGAIGLVVCYDMAGNLMWEVDIGVLHSGWFYDPDFQWGHSSSPIIYEGKVIVQADTPFASFIAALDVGTGAEVWRTTREEEISTFATPSVYSGATGDELITNGTQMRAYDPASGELLWFLGPNSEIPIATPIIADDLIYLTAGYPPIRPIYAVRPGNRGDLSLRDGGESSEAIAWSKDRGGTYIPTPLVYEGYFYTNANNGRLTCYDAATGEIVYRKRIGGVGGSYSASPVGADGKLYFFSEEGDVYVVRAGPEYELLAVNSMDEIVVANPAISDGVMVIRTLNHVYGIADS